MASAEKNQEPQPKLGLFDAISIIVGIVIGTMIFKVPWLIFGNTSDPFMGLTVWLVAGILMLIGAMCYAELASTYPRASGGDYYYLTRAYSPWMGFLFGWAQLIVLFPTAIGAMAFVFGEYATHLFDLTSEDQTLVDLAELDQQLGNIGLRSDFIYAILAVILLTLLNVLGVVLGKLTQNFLTLVKIVSLGAILVAGFGYAQSLPQDWTFSQDKLIRFEGPGGQGIKKDFTFRNPDWEIVLGLDADKKFQAKVKNLKKVPQNLALKLVVRTRPEAADEENEPEVIEVKAEVPFAAGEEQSSGPKKPVAISVLSYGSADDRTGIYEVNQVAVAAQNIGWAALAIILVFYAYGGWSDAAFVAAEVRDPQRNLPRALIFGLSIIIVVYLLVNAAYITGLGFEEASKFDPKPLPSRLLDHAFGEQASSGMSILVVISALGAINGLTFTGARIYATLGNDYVLFTWLGHWRPGRSAPILALLVEAIITLAMIFMLGTDKGHELINIALTSVHIKHQSNWSGETAFEALFAHSAPIFWTLFLLTGFSLFLLRSRDHTMPRAFAVPFYPWLPIIFCTTSAYMLFEATKYVGWRALFAVVLVLVGVPLYWLARLCGGYRGDALK